MSRDESSAQESPLLKACRWSIDRRARTQRRNDWAGFDGKDPSRHRSDERTTAEALLRAEHILTSEPLVLVPHAQTCAASVQPPSEGNYLQGHRVWIPSTLLATTTGHPPGLPSEGPATCDLLFLTSDPCDRSDKRCLPFPRKIKARVREGRLFVRPTCSPSPASRA